MIAACAPRSRGCRRASWTSAAAATSEWADAPPRRHRSAGRAGARRSGGGVAGGDHRRVGLPDRAPARRRPGVLLRQEVRRPPRFSIVGGNSEAGVADVSRGIVDVAMVSRPRAPGDPARLSSRRSPRARSAWSPTGATRCRAWIVPGSGAVGGPLTAWERIAARAAPDRSSTPRSRPGRRRSPSSSRRWSTRRPSSRTRRGLLTAAPVRAFMRHAGSVGLRRPGLHRGVARRAVRGRAVHAANGGTAATPGGASSRWSPAAHHPGRCARFLRWIRTGRTARR